MQAYNKIPSYFFEFFMHVYEISVAILTEIFLTITYEKILCAVV